MRPAEFIHSILHIRPGTIRSKIGIDHVSSEAILPLAPRNVDTSHLPTQPITWGLQSLNFTLDDKKDAEFLEHMDGLVKLLGQPEFWYSQVYRPEDPSVREAIKGPSWRARIEGYLAWAREYSRGIKSVPERDRALIEHMLLWHAEIWIKAVEECEMARPVKLPGKRIPFGEMCDFLLKQMPVSDAYCLCMHTMATTGNGVPRMEDPTGTMTEAWFWQRRMAQAAAKPDAEEATPENDTRE